jgi:hypothetical protein
MARSLLNEGGSSIGGSPSVLDLVLIFVVIAFFAACGLYVRACERL